MAIQIQGNAGTVGEVESTHRTYRITSRPMELGARGAYALGVVSGTMAAGLAANAEIFQMRWTSSTLVMLVRSVILSAMPGSTGFTAGFGEFSLTAARSWSADGGAGTPVVFSTANTNKKRTDFALSAFSDTGVRVSSTATLTAGTKTLDTNKLASISTYVSSVGSATVASPLVPAGTYMWQRNTPDEYPLLLEQNEGFVVRATVPATGIWQFSVNVEWAELDPAAVTGW